MTTASPAYLDAGPSSSAGADPFVHDLAQLLIPPALLATPSWKLMAASDTQKYHALRRWIKRTAPSHLCRLLRHITTTLHDAGAAPLSRRDGLLVVQSACRFLGDDDWSTPKSRRAARALLDLPPLRPTLDELREVLLDVLRPLFRANPSATSDASDRSHPTLHPSSARLEPARVGLPPSMRHSDMEEDVVWKGGRAVGSSSSGSSSVIAAATRIDVVDRYGQGEVGASSAATELRTRAPALGCWNLVWWCCHWSARLAWEAAAHEHRSDGVEASSAIGAPRAGPSSVRVWDEVLPLIVPPLLTLLEDPNPRYRARGASCLRALLLDVPVAAAAHGRRHLRQGHEARRARVRHCWDVTMSLERMRLTPLLLQQLRASFAYTTHPHGARLLHVALDAATELVLRSTAPEHQYDGDGDKDGDDGRVGGRSKGEGLGHGAGGAASRSPRHDGRDGLARRRRRHDELSELLEQAVLRVWTYATSSTHPSGWDECGTDDDETDRDDAGFEKVDEARRGARGGEEPRRGGGLGHEAGAVDGPPEARAAVDTSQEDYDEARASAAALSVSRRSRETLCARAWPPPRATSRRSVRGGEEGGGDDGGGREDGDDEVGEGGDAVVVACAHLPELLGCMGAASARYLSLCLDFVCQNLERAATAAAGTTTASETRGTAPRRRPGRRRGDGSGGAGAEVERITCLVEVLRRIVEVYLPAPPSSSSSSSSSSWPKADDAAPPPPLPPGLYVWRVRMAAALIKVWQSAATRGVGQGREEEDKEGDVDAALRREVRKAWRSVVRIEDALAAQRTMPPTTATAGSASGASPPSAVRLLDAREWLQWQPSLRGLVE